MTGPAIGSLFSGYGGLDSGVMQVFGGEVAWHAEIEPAACRILDRWFPGVPNLGDVSGADWGASPPVDILAGGFPCTDVSTAGRRAGLHEGTRSGLWNMYARAIDALRPGLVVIENVKGLLHASASSDRWTDLGCQFCDVGDGGEPSLRALGAVLGDLADLGYDARWGLFRASDVGAPHRRQRVFAVARPEGDADPLGGRWERAEPVGVGDAVGEVGAGDEDGPAADPDGAGAGVERPDVEAEPWADGEEARLDLEAIARTEWSEYGPAIERWAVVMGRPAPHPVYQAPSGATRLNPVFVEWLMGLEEGRVTGAGLPFGAQLKALGNGVVPQQAAHAIRSLLAWRPALSGVPNG